MLKKSASVVLTSEASSTYPRGYASGAFIGCGLAGRAFLSILRETIPVARKSSGFKPSQGICIEKRCLH